MRTKTGNAPLRTGFLAAVTAVLLAGAAPAGAQATRTWVSGVGDDANPCSRTAPCKTFAGAISKTAAGGEISVLDPGGFGAVTITKSITITSESTGEAGIIAAGTNGVVVNAGPADAVTLRGLVIFGSGTGLNGIRFLAGGVLRVEKTLITRFQNGGIDVNLAAAGGLTVVDTDIRECGGAGISLNDSVGTLDVTIDGVHVSNTLIGVHAKARALVTIHDSDLNQGEIGVFAEQDSRVLLDGARVTNNTTGVWAASTAPLRLSDTVVFGNGTGIVSTGAGGIHSFKNNKIAGNTADGAPNAIVNLQ